MGPRAILGGYVQSQMRLLKDAIDVLGILWVFHGYGAIFRVLVQGIISRICGDDKRFSVFGDKTRYFVFNLGGSKYVCFNDSFSQPPIKVWKKSQPLRQ